MSIAVASSQSLHMPRGRWLLFTLCSGRHGAGSWVEDPELVSRIAKRMGTKQHLQISFAGANLFLTKRIQ